ATKTVCRRPWTSWSTTRCGWYASAPQPRRPHDPRRAPHPGPRRPRPRLAPQHHAGRRTGAEAGAHDRTRAPVPLLRALRDALPVPAVAARGERAPGRGAGGLSGGPAEPAASARRDTRRHAGRAVAARAGRAARAAGRG